MLTSQNRTREAIKFGYRRWLGFLKANYPDDFSTPPAERITMERVRAFIEHLRAEVRPPRLPISVGLLYAAARLIDPATDWSWLRSVKSRLQCLARPQDRFDRLVPPVRTLDFGIELMEQRSRATSDGHKQREIQYRDGLLLVVLSHLADTPARPRRAHRQPSYRVRRCWREYSLVSGRHQGLDARRAFRVPEGSLPYSCAI